MRKALHLPALLAGVSLALSSLVVALPAQAQCIGGSPAFGVDDSLWGSLQPTDVGQIPDPRDSTNYHGQTRPDSRYPLFSDIDVEGGYAYLSYSSGFQVWNITGAANQANPQLAGAQDGWMGGFCPTGCSAGPEPDGWVPGNSETRELVFSVNVPDGNGNLAVTGGISPVGVTIWNTTNKSAPKAIYSDGARTSYQVFSAQIGPTSYAFAAAEQTGIGVHVYNMSTAAQNFPNGCAEDTSSGQINCPGVYQGRIGGNQPASYVTGLKTGARQLIAFSSGVPVRGVEIYDVSNPQIPINLKQGGGRYLSGDIVYGLAMWEQGSSQYLAATRVVGAQSKLSIYNISSCINGGCSTLPGPLWTSPALAGSSSRYFVTYSKDGSTPFLFLGLEDQCSPGLHREYLLDVSNPSSPDEIGTEVPPVNWPNAGGNPNPYPIDYWSWYYSKSPTGFSLVMPRVARFKDGFLYRAAWTIFDVHRRGSLTPTINISGPSTGYAGDPIGFNATAANCTPAANGWSWTTGGGSGSSSTSSITINWASPGNKTVTATNSACPGALGSVTIGIANPAPSIGSVTASPSTAPVCTPITFTANNVTGRPPLTFAWTVEQGGSPLPGVNGSTNPFVWNTTGALPGSYSGEVAVSGTGDPATGSAPVTLTALPALPSPGFPITNDPFTSGTVQFHSTAAGATEWSWNFGDGTIFTTTDPTQGPNPVHTYTAVGGYQVTLQVRNCQNPGFITSAPLSINVVQIDPLIISQFQAQCPFGICGFNTGVAIPFTTVVSGDPDFFDYDWDGDTQFDQVGLTSPVATHTYTVAGTYRPVLRLRRGAESVTFQHALNIVVSTGGPPPTPSISVAGPTSGTPGNAYHFTASATNCSPAASGWTWTTSGGSGSSTNSSIDVTWSSTGAKTVTARNTACSSASGSKTITITNGGGNGGGNLVANFTFSPPNPQVGQNVSFDASSSTGTIGSYSWDFGDGGSANGSSASHSFGSTGTFPVTLSVAAPSCTSPACTDVTTLDVVVGGGSGACVANASTLCLLDGRFEVSVHFRDHHNGDQEGDGKVMPFPHTAQTGAFWFFRPTNVELLVKMVDNSTDPEHPAFWVFYGALTDVEYWLTVYDTEGDVTREYHNLPGTVCGDGDTGAFPQGNGGGFGTGTLIAAPLGGMEIVPAPALEPVDGAVTGTCVPSSDHLCLLDNRFQVEVAFYDQHNDQTGDGVAIAGTNQAGFFWFFNQNNLELVVKMVDATSQPTPRFWVFWGGLSDVQYTVDVTDTLSTQTWRYTNPPGNICGGYNLGAFSP
jgi:PKD repeat protein